MLFVGVQEEHVPNVRNHVGSVFVRELLVRGAPQRVQLYLVFEYPISFLRAGGKHFSPCEQMVFFFVSSKRCRGTHCELSNRLERE